NDAGDAGGGDRDFVVCRSPVGFGKNRGSQIKRDFLGDEVQRGRSPIAKAISWVWLGMVVQRPRRHHCQQDRCPMKYNLRSLMLVVLVLPPLLALAYWGLRPHIIHEWRQIM